MQFIDDTLMKLEKTRSEELGGDSGEYSQGFSSDCRCCGGRGDFDTSRSAIVDCEFVV